jgi:hypothetical protein
MKLLYKWAGYENTGAILLQGQPVPTLAGLLPLWQGLMGIQIIMG